MINSRKIEDLKPIAQLKCREFITACEEAGLKIKIIQTLRDAEYQHSLYLQGRDGDKRPIVTHKDGYEKESNHQGGLAWDAVPLDDKGVILWKDNKKFKQMADIAIKLGIRAGHYWKMVDSPHFEI